MTETRDSRDTNLHEFHRLFWDDFDSGRARPVEEYLVRFPGLEAEIRQEVELANRSLEPGEETPASARQTLPSGQDVPATARAAEEDEATPTRIGRYEVIRRLKKGGMGLLFLARDQDLGRTVVLKTPKSLWLGSGSEAVERLKREARIGGRLGIDGICPVLDVVLEGDRVFVVMQYIPGETLGERIRAVTRGSDTGADPRVLWQSLFRHPEGGAGSADPGTHEDSSPATGAGARAGDLRATLRLLEKVARTMHQAHEAGIVHRDLKPDNIMIRSATGDPVVLDLGLALDLSGEAASRLTQEGQILGTPDYMAPEQVAGDPGRVDRKTDVYALGVILYELLTLRRPFPADSPSAAFARILRGDATPPRKINRLIPRDLEAVCLKAMDLVPEHRYPTALQFAEDLHRVRAVHQTVAKPLTLAGWLLRRTRRHPWTVLAFAATVLLAVATATSVLELSEERRRNQAWETVVRSDPRIRALIGDHPLTPESLVIALEKLPSTTRSVEDTAERLLSPLAKISEDRPVFRFEVPPPGGQTWHYRLSIKDWKGQTTAFVIEQTPHQQGPLSFSLPPGMRLKSGEYQWTVEVADPGHESWKPVKGEFSVVSAATGENLVRSGGVLQTERSLTNRLLRAAVLIADEYAEDAWQVLAEEPSGATEQERLLYEFLCAHADSLLGNDEKIQERIERLRAERR